MTLVDDHSEEEIDLSSPDHRAAGRFSSMGVPGLRSRDFKTALRRLAGMLAAP